MNDEQKIEHNKYLDKLFKIEIDSLIKFGPASVVYNKKIISKYGDAPIHLDYFYNGES